MRSVSGGAGRVMYGRRSLPFDILHFVHNGQSLSVGYNQTPVSTAQPYANLMMTDSLGETGYIITEPDAGTLSLVPLVAPERAIQGGAGILVYPKNVDGESAEIAFCNQLSQLYVDASYSRPICIPSCTGQGSALMNTINQGTIPYNAGVYECEVIARGNTGPTLPGYPTGKTFGTMGVLFTHGESDAVDNAANNIQVPTVYLGQLTSLAPAYQASFRGVLGQQNKTAIIPFFVSSQQSSPGQLTGWNTTAWADLLFCQANPTTTVYACPKYQFPPGAGGIHLADYRPYGEKLAQSYMKYQAGLAANDPLLYAPLWMTAISVTGDTVTVTYFVPVPPLVFDTTTLPAPHQSGNWVAWALGLGFEAWDNNNTLTAATNTTPIQITTTNPHNQTTGNSYSVQGVLGNTAANGTWTVTVIDADNLTLNASVGNGAYTEGGQSFEPITISSATVASDTVVLVLARTPGADLTIAYAEHQDGTYTTIANGFRSGNLRDSDPFVGASAASPIPGVPLPQPIWANWAVEEFHQVPYSLAFP
jgi:hypothetical protein